MFVPKPPILRPLEQITPSIYEASIDCLAKAAWYALGARGVLPEHPAAMLGTAFHSVVAAAHRGELSVAAESDRLPARQLFDSTSQSLYDQLHPLTKLKHPTAAHMPYYSLNRERCALLAARIASTASAGRRSTTEEPAPAGRPPRRTEILLRSSDGLVAGRPDHIDGASKTAVDYKSGYTPEDRAGFVSDSEARQLRLYAYLATENRISISTGVIVRGDGQRCELPITDADASAEADSARRRLQELNAAVGSGSKFDDLTSPSRENCRSCPCIPFCSSFWTAARPDWQRNVGLHVEGEVLDLATCQAQGVSLTTVDVLVRCRAISAPRVCAEQIPTAWMLVQGGDALRAGDCVRLVHGRQLTADDTNARIRVDKALTAVWVKPTEAEEIVPAA